MCEIDIYFDCNKGQLFLRPVQDSKTDIELKIWNIPTHAVTNWIPFVSTQIAIDLTCTRIPTNYYGHYIPQSQYDLILFPKEDIPLLWTVHKS